MSKQDASSLVVVGFGIKFLSHLTTEAKVYIEKADKVLYLVNDPVVKDWISKNTKNSESLDTLYQSYNLRQDSYHAIAEYILASVRQQQHVCAVFYGHPTVFAQPGIIAVNQARKEGFDARILPGISAEDCLFADLLINPGSCGCQSFEATDFLIYKRPFSPTSHLILWQIGFIGALNHPRAHDNTTGIKLLFERLAEQYDHNHEIILYEAAQYPLFEPRIDRIPLKKLNKTAISAITTLYVPPMQKAKPDIQVIDLLGIKLGS